MDRRRPFQHDDVGADRGQQERVAPEAGGGVDDARDLILLEPGGSHQRMATAVAAAKPETDRAARKIDPQLAAIPVHARRYSKKADRGQSLSPSFRPPACRAPE